ncbi:Dual specificity protein phosphatase 13 [Balamuthia mandrillaris]
MKFPPFEEQERKRRMEERRLSPPSEILPWLFLGSQYHAADDAALEQLGITCILNVVGGMYPSEYDPDRFRMEPLSDYGRDSLEVKLQPCFAFLKQVKQRKEKVLVHCAMGVNRSSTVVIGYLVRHEKWALRKAYEHLVERRPQVQPHPEYLKQLRKLEVAWRGSSSVDDELEATLFPPFHLQFSKMLATLSTEEENKKKQNGENEEEQKETKIVDGKKMIRRKKKKTKKKTKAENEE